MNDAISRSALKKEALTVNIGPEFNPCMESMVYESDIDEAPALDVAPVVHARWVGGKYYNDVYGYEKTCTACQKEYVVVFDYLYCPYCGARMDGEKVYGTD